MNSLISRGTLAAMQDSLARTSMLPVKSIFQAEAESFPEAIKAVIEGLQARLEKDEELCVYYTNGVELIRVGHVTMFKTHMAVIQGRDNDGNDAFVVAHFKSLQFVCKVLKVGEAKEKTKIGFTMG